MAFRLSLRYKGSELFAREDSTDDPVTAIVNCRMFQGEVLPILKKNLPAFKRVNDGDIERRIDRIDLQLPLGKPVMNGSH